MNVNATNDLVSLCGNTLTRNSVTIPKLPPLLGIEIIVTLAKLNGVTSYSQC